MKLSSDDVAGIMTCARDANCIYFHKQRGLLISTDLSRTTPNTTIVQMTQICTGLLISADLSYTTHQPTQNRGDHACHLQPLHCALRPMRLMLLRMSVTNKRRGWSIRVVTASTMDIGYSDRRRRLGWFPL